MFLNGSIFYIQGTKIIKWNLRYRNYKMQDKVSEIGNICHNHQDSLIHPEKVSESYVACYNFWDDKDSWLRHRI